MPARQRTRQPPRNRFLAGHRFLIEWLSVGILAAACVMLCVTTAVAERANAVVYDTLLSHFSVGKPSSKIVIVAIDDPSIAKLGQWPWPRSTHARLLDQLAKARPLAVGFDVAFTEPTTDDDALARAMHAVPTFLPFLIDRQPVNRTMPTALLPVPVLNDAAAATGHIEVDADRDGIVRVVALNQIAGANRWPALMAQIYRAMRGDTAPLPGRDLPSTASASLSPLGDASHDGANASEASDGLPRKVNRMLIPFSAASADYPEVPYEAVLDGAVPPSFFEGKIVLVGATAEGLHDRFGTPLSGTLGQLPGVNIQATVLDALLAGTAIEPLRRVPACALSLLPLVLLLGALLMMSQRSALMFSVALTLANLLGSVVLLLTASLWWSPIPAIAGVAITYVLWSWRRLEVAMTYLTQELGQLAAEPHLLGDESTDRERLGGDVLERLIALTRQAARRQRTMRQFVSDSLNSLAEPVLVCGKQGEILMVNDAAVTFFGPRQFWGRTVMEVLAFFAFVRTVADASETAAAATPATVPRAVSAPWPALLDPRTADHLAVLMQGIEVRDARGRDYMMRYAPCTTHAGSAIGWIVSWVDVTALHAAERQRDEMLHVLSHDMRSPQASILNLLEQPLLSAHAGAYPSQRPEQRAHAWVSSDTVERIRRYARRTLALADDMVQLARAEAARYRLEPCDLRDLAINACDDVWPLAQAKGIDIESPSEGEAVWIAADGSLILRALINLLDNAIKYSPEGAKVACWLDVTKAVARITISDTGYGIPLDQQAHLFERFRRFHTPGQPRIEGTGLGMAFVHVVVQRHGGQIAVESALGKGTEVSVTLPLPKRGEPGPANDI